MSAQFRAQFNKKLVELLGDKDLSSFHLTKTKYCWIIDRLKVLASTRLKKESKDYRLQRRYESFVVPITGEVRLKKKDTNLLYVYDEELFDTINEIHVQTGHGARDVMNAKVKKKYANVTKEVLQLFADICDQCQLKKRGRKLSAIKPQPPPTTSTDNVAHCRSEVDLIDMSSTPDGAYRYIMLYKDQRTNFMCLKPLKTEDPKEVANLLIDIFCMMGAPNVLESGNGRQFASKIVKEVKLVWPKCVIMHGGSNETETVCRLGELVNKLDIMMKAAQTDKWAHLLRFLQWDQNTVEVEEGCKNTPHANTFTNRPSLGLNSLNLPKDIVNGLECEEDLVQAVKRPPPPPPPQPSPTSLKVTPTANSTFSAPAVPVKVEHFEEHDQWTYIRQPCQSPHTSDEELLGDTAKRSEGKSPSSSPPPLHRIENTQEYRSHKYTSSSSGSSSDIDVESLDGEEISVQQVVGTNHQSPHLDDIGYQRSDADAIYFETKHNINFEDSQRHRSFHDSKADLVSDVAQQENDLRLGRPNFRDSLHSLCAQSDPRNSLSIDDIRRNPNLEAICSVLEILRARKLNTKYESSNSNRMNNNNCNMNNINTNSSMNIINTNSNMNSDIRYSYQTISGLPDMYERPHNQPWHYSVGRDQDRINGYVQREEVFGVAAKRFRTA